MTNDESDSVTNSPYVVTGAEDYRWTVDAFDLIQKRLLAVTIERRGQQRRVTASGMCPNCKHDVDFDHTDKVQAPTAGGGLGGLVVSPPMPPEPVVEWETAEVRCSCRLPHAGRSEEVKTGCGIAFSVECRPKRRITS